MSKVIEPCPKCELPIDPEQKSAELHERYCIGQTPYVLHNRKAGMVVYLSEEEWMALQNSGSGLGQLDEETAARIAGRAVFGIEDPTTALPAEG